MFNKKTAIITIIVISMLSGQLMAMKGIEKTHKMEELDPFLRLKEFFTVCSKIAEEEYKKKILGDTTRRIIIKPFLCEHEGCYAGFVNLQKLNNHNKSHKQNDFLIHCIPCNRWYSNAYFATHLKTLAHKKIASKLL